MDEAKRPEADGDVTPVVELRLPYRDAVRLSYLMRFGGLGDQERDALIAETVDIAIDAAELELRKRRY